METCIGLEIVFVDGILETFLGGMETPVLRLDILVSLAPLKPSLVEWKPQETRRRRAKAEPLKPSLVEWKQILSASAPGTTYPTLKPSLVEWKQGLKIPREVVPVPLETFLGGMETGGVRVGPIYSTNLETFLGGMETEGAGRGAHHRPRALKPSLVEWKHTQSHSQICLSHP